MPKLIDFGGPFGVVSFPDDATDEYVVDQYNAIRGHAIREADIRLKSALDEVERQQPTLEKYLVRTGLGLGEQTAGAAKQMVGNLARTAADVFAVPKSKLQRGPDVDLSDPELPINILREAGKSLEEEGKSRRIAAAELGETVGGGIGPTIAENLAGTAGISATVLPAAVFGLGPAAVTAALQSYSLNLSEFRDILRQRNPGLSEEEAFQQAQVPAALTGAATGVLTRGFGGVERFIQKAVTEGIGKEGIKALLRDAFRSASLEFPEEYLDQLAQGFTEKAFVNPDKPIDAIFREAGLAGLAGFALGGLTTGAIAGPVVAAQELNERVIEPSRIRRQSRRESVERIKQVIAEREAQNAEETRTIPVTPSQEIAPFQEETRGLRVRDTAQDRLETETIAPVVTPIPPSVISPPVTTPTPTPARQNVMDETPPEWRSELQDTIDYLRSTISDSQELADAIKQVREEIQARPKPNPVTPPEVAVQGGSAIADRVRQVLSEGGAITRREVMDIGTQAGVSQREAEEWAELGGTEAARLIAQGAGTPAEKYWSLVDLYNRMPRSGTRTVESKVAQQYSTPPPLAWVGSVLADVGSGSSFVDPTAGHGMLSIGANPQGTVVLNELDKNRQIRLRRFAGEGGVLGINATAPEFLAVLGQTKPDRIGMNPPFGSVLDEQGNPRRFQIQGASTTAAETTSIDIAIVLNALNAMSDNGKAFAIIGSKTGTPFGAKFGSDEQRAEGYRRPVFLDLFKRFNVVDWFTIGGELYEKMGAAWPVDMIIVHGKGATKSADAGGLVRPWIKPPRVISTWEQLAELLPKDETKPARIGPGETGVRPVGDTGQERTGGTERQGAPEIRPDRPEPPAPSARGRNPAVPVERPVPTPPPPPVVAGDSSTGIGTGTSTPAGTVVVSGTTTKQPGTIELGGTGALAVGPGTTEPKQPELRPKASVSVEGLPASLMVPYVGVSTGPSLSLVAPRNIATQMLSAQQELESQIGQPLDQFVATRLGRDVATLHKQMAGAQIDAAALAFRNLEMGSALITADETGVGKGRIVAAIIEYARLRNLIPVFVTAKKNLYSDMVGRDLPALGNRDFVPFITDGQSYYEDGHGREQKSNRTNQEMTDLMNEIARTGALPQGVDGIFTTYDQLKADRPKGWSETPKQKFARKRKRTERPDGARWAMLRSLAPRSIYILDEAHLAAGLDSELNLKFGSVLPLASGVYYSSATFAKRPDNLGIYALGTGMKLSGLNNTQLTEALKKGGVPMQQALTSMLASSGELVRRQQDWTGVEMRFKATSADPEVDIEAADTFTSFVRDLMTLAKIVNSAGKAMEDNENQVRADEETVKMEPITFGSRLFNLSNQYLLSLRSEAIVREAVEELKAGRKPFIALYNTMEGPISDLRARNLPLSFNGILRREMAKMLKLTVRDPMAEGGKREVELQPEDLPDGGAFFRNMEEQIEATDLTRFPISPIDFIRRGIEQAGYKVGEMTARDSEVDDTGAEIVITKREKSNRNKILKDYNDGVTDVLIVNGSGSTGLSAHTDPRFKDQRQRVQIVGQPAPDINEFMQMLGRVMRSGQTSKPIYKILNTALAAERRFATMLRGKMTSLNANTTAEGESGMTQSEGFADDIFNSVGDEVVFRVMSANQDLANLIEIGIDADTEVFDGFARYTTGRFVLLPNADAQKLWDEIISEFKAELEQLDESGANPLRAVAEDLRAKTITQSNAVEGTGTTPFDGPAVLEQATVKPPKLPPTHDEATFAATSNQQAVKDAAAQWISGSKQAESERLRVAMERGNSPEQLDNIRQTFQNVRIAVTEAYRKMGDTFGVDMLGDGSSAFYGVAVDLKLNGKSVSDFASASRQQLILRTNTYKGKLTIPLSKLYKDGEEQKFLNLLDESEAKEKFNSTAETTATRHIVTGNLLRGWDYADTSSSREGGRPRVAIFTREDGSLSTGILMPPNWQPSQQAGVVPIDNARTFSIYLQQQSPMRSTTMIGVHPVQVAGGRLLVPSNNQAKALWGDPQFNSFFSSTPQQVSGQFSGVIDQAMSQQLFEFLNRKGVRLVLSAQAGQTTGPDRIDSALTSAIDALRPDRTRLQSQVLPVWLIQDAARAALIAARAAYRGGKAIAEAIRDGVDYLRSLNLSGFNEQEASDWLLNAIAQTPPEQLPPIEGLQVAGASSQVGRVADSIYKSREAGGLALEGLAYQRKQFKMARSELKRLSDIAYGRFGASLQEGESAIIPDPTEGVGIDEDGNIVVGDEFSDLLTAAEVEHDTDNVQSMQAELFFEGAARRLNNLIANIETLQNATKDYETLKVDEKEIKKLNRRIGRISGKAAALGSASLNGVTVSERASEIRSAEASRQSRMAQRDSLSLEPVADFFGRQVGAYRTFLNSAEAATKLAQALRSAATTQEDLARLSEQAEEWVRLPDDVRSAITAGMPLSDEQRASAFASLATVFDDFDITKARMREMQANRTPEIDREIRRLFDKIASAKIQSGTAEVLISDVLNALDGETGGTGTLQSQAVAQELKSRLAAIQRFALSIGNNLERHQDLFDWLANPTSQKSFIAANAEAYGVSAETLAMILSEVKRNPAFGSAIVTLIESSDKKLANLPIVQLEQIQSLMAEGKQAEAKALANRVMDRAKANASMAEVAQRDNLKQLDALEIEKQALANGVAMFDELEASPEFQLIRGVVSNSPYGLVEPMVAQNNTATTFKPFGAKGIPEHAGLILGATDNPALKDQAFKRVAEWHKTAQEYLDAYAAAEALHNSDPANNPPPAQLGFDLAKVRGLRDAVERFVPGSFLELSLLSDNKRWKVPWLVRQLNKFAWFRQHDFVSKMVGGEAGTDLRGRLGDFVNHFLISRSIIQKYREIPDLLHQAMRSHPSMNMNMADYREMWNELAHWGRMFGSPVQVGFVLPRSGVVVSKEDMALLKKQRQFEEELRRRVTETTPVAGVRLQRGGRELVRAGAYVGDEGLPRHLNHQADTFIADVLAAYAPQNGQVPAFGQTTDLSASSTDPLAKFWNERTDLLVQHVLDSRRGDRAMRLGGLMQQAETNTSTDWMAIGTPPIQSLEDLVNELVSHFPSAPGLNIRDHVVNGLNSELRQYRDAANRIEQERRERAQARSSKVQISFSADNEFTRPAAKLELPSRFYDYGAITPAEHILVTSRANHERIVAYSTALQRAIGDLRNRLARYREPGSTLTEQQIASSYGGNIEEMKQVLGILQKVAHDFEMAYATGNPALTQSQWYRDTFGLLTSAVLALPVVNLRNMTQGQFEVYMMSRAMGLSGHRLSMWRALKNMVKTLTRYGLHVGGGAMKRMDLASSVLTGKNVQIFEKLVDGISHLLLTPDYRTSADRVHELGYDSRDGFLDRMKRIWQETAEFSDREDLESTLIPGTERKLAATLGVPAKALRAAFERIGVQESDLTINSSLLIYAEWLEKRLGEVATAYGEERERQGLTDFDATDPRWQLQPDEWAAFSSKQQNTDSLGLFRLFLETSANAEGFQLERTLWDFYRQQQAGQHPRIFTPRQFDAVQRALISQFNASTPANRASAAAGNNIIRNMLTLQGYVSDGLLKLINSTMGGARDRTAVSATLGKLPIVGMLALMAILIGYFQGGITGEWEKRMRGKLPTLPTPFDRDFWSSWKKLGSNTLRLGMAQLFYLGDLLLLLRNEIQGNRGFDPAGRIFPISMFQSALNTLRGMWTTQGTVGDKLVPMADFGRKTVPWWAEIENAFGESQGVIKQGERALRGEAQAQDLLPASRSSSMHGPQYGPTTVVRRMLGEAVSDYWKATQSGDTKGATKALAQANEELRKLREFYAAKYAASGMDPEEAQAKAQADVWRDYNEINPVVSAMMGKRPTAGEWQLLRGAMTGDRWRTVDNAVAAWQAGATALFGREGQITKEDVADSRRGGGSAVGVPDNLSPVTGLRVARRGGRGSYLRTPRATTISASPFQPAALPRISTGRRTRRTGRTRMRRPTGLLRRSPRISRVRSRSRLGRTRRRAYALA